MKAEAKEVVEAVGAWMYCFQLPADGSISNTAEATMKAVQEISEEHAGYGADTVMLAVGLSTQSKAHKITEEEREIWDDLCMQYGFEFIDYAAQGKNEFGEKTGFERLKEALEANEWTGTAASDDGQLDLEGLELEDEDNLDGFARDEAEMTAELFGMKASIAGDNFDPEADDFIPPAQQEHEVEHLDRLMGRLLAVKEQSADLPLEQRKKMAAKAVKELFKSGEGT
jgi:alpha- and gamma-adaptin-binding protein p34